MGIEELKAFCWLSWNLFVEKRDFACAESIGNISIHRFTFLLDVGDYVSLDFLIWDDVFGLHAGWKA